jgi:hypothetical protein
MSARFCLALGCAIAFTFVSGVASAQVRRSEYRHGGGYHEFLDDPLQAAGSAASGWVLKVRRTEGRVTLIRPRTTFVPELLKTVEVM